jgi:hypothetical protein
MMIKRTRSFLTTVAAAAFSATITASPVRSQVAQDAPRNTASHANPSSGQINSGVSVQPAAGAPLSDTHAATNRPIPTPQEARAALLAPDNPDPAIGQIALPPSSGGNASKSAPGEKPAENAKAQQSDDDAQSHSGSSTGNESTGSATREDTGKQAAFGTSPNKPIGSTTQTLPAKFSKRNDVLARVPTMAWPLRLNDEERGQLFDAVMTAKGDIVDVGGLKAADQLPPELALNAMHALPQHLAARPVLHNIQVVKGKNEILLVNPATRIVVDVMSNSK